MSKHKQGIEELFIADLDRLKTGVWDYLMNTERKWYERIGRGRVRVTPESFERFFSILIAMEEVRAGGVVPRTELLRCFLGDYPQDGLLFYVASSYYCGGLGFDSPMYTNYEGRNTDFDKMLKKYPKEYLVSLLHLKKWQDPITDARCHWELTFVGDVSGSTNKSWGCFIFKVVRKLKRYGDPFTIDEYYERLGREK